MMERLLSSLISTSQRRHNISCSLRITDLLLIKQRPGTRPTSRSSSRYRSRSRDSVTCRSSDYGSGYRFFNSVSISKSSLFKSLSVLKKFKGALGYSCYRTIITKTPSHDKTGMIKQTRHGCSKSLFHTSWVSSLNNNSNSSMKISEDDMNKKSVTLEFGKEQCLPDLKNQIIFQNGQNADGTSLKENLPNLAQDLNCHALDIGISLKSYYSGVLVLTKNEIAAKELHRFLQHADAQKQCCMSFLAITVGSPQCQQNKDIELMIQRDFLHGREMSLVSEKEFSKSGQRSLKIQRKLVKVTYNVQVLAENQETRSALVQIKVNKLKWEACEVFLSHFLSPVLGDNIYSGRTHFVMGVPFPTPPKAAAPGLQKLPREISKALSCHESDLPLFLHLHKVTVCRFPKPASPTFDIRAPPSETFIRFLKLLGLHQNLGNINLDS